MADHKEQEAPKFDAKWLKGLSFRTSKKEKVKTDGGEKAVYRPVERPLKEDDLLSWRIDGGQVVLVTKDGRKYRIDK